MSRRYPVTTDWFVGSTFSRRDVVKLVAGGTVLGIGGVLGSRQFVAAQATPAVDLSAYPAVTITAENAPEGDGYVFGVPESLPTGYVNVTLENKSDGEHHAMFMRMADGVTPEQFIEKAKSTPNPGEFASMATSIGGPGSISPNQSTSAIMNLEEGPYVLICEVPGPDGVPHYQMGMINEVQAKAEGTPVTTAPTSETTVDLVDFSFVGLPETLAAGQHIWEVHNTGPEPHEMIIMKLAPGITSELAYNMLVASEAPAGTPEAEPASTPEAAPASPEAGGAPPFVAVAGSAPMDPDNTVWPIIDVDSGDYVALCFIPDPATGKPHIMLGMYGSFTVQ